MNRPRRAGPRLLAALATVSFAAAALAGCANIPDESAPQALGPGDAQAASEIAQPDPDSDAFELVRDFVLAAGNPEAAKAYLTSEARDTWQSAGPPTIVNDKIDTIPQPIADRKAQGDGLNNEVIVGIGVTEVGRLDDDRAFVPSTGQQKFHATVRRQPSGEWRIAIPPPVLLITQSDFNQNYRQISVYFFDPDLRVTVPDLRYVPARPPSDVPTQVIARLLGGPSNTLKGAVQTLLDPSAETSTNVVVDRDGALVVNLTKLGDKTPEQKRLIAAQLVLSLSKVAPSRIRLLVDGAPLVPERPEWRPSDIPSYEMITVPNVELTGLFVAAGQVRSLNDGLPIPGPAGRGEYLAGSAAQSIDGKSLAVVTGGGAGARLRVGRFGEGLREVDLTARTLTRPTWQPSTGTEPGREPESESNELWTVKDGRDVVRIVRTGADSWRTSAVNALTLKSFGEITELRLSRDGVRLAMVAGGRLVVATVVRTRDSVTIRSPRTVLMVKDVVGVDWAKQDTMVAATRQDGQPVVSVPVDGSKFDRYSSANVGVPVHAVAAAPDRPVIVTDRNGMWTADEPIQVWRVHPIRVDDATPFYPG